MIKPWFALLLASLVSCSPNQESTNVKNFLRHKGLPTFIVKSMNVEGNCLAYSDLELLDPNEKKILDKVRNCGLIYCNPRDTLWIWAAVTEIKMQKATPFMGQERPGAKFLLESPSKREYRSKLLAPAQVFVASIDERDMVSRTASITVQVLQLEE